MLGAEETWILSSLICQLYACQANKPGTAAYQSFCTDFAPWPQAERAKELSESPDHQGGEPCLAVPGFHQLWQLFTGASPGKAELWHTKEGEAKCFKRQKASSIPCPFPFFSGDNDLLKMVIGSAPALCLCLSTLLLDSGVSV